ncbi:MarR family transcriptional regulator [Ahrensia sp. R2A130]|nr:MarR family transcriptional regulator [Ahrensia sp. R2A130]
MSASGGTTVEMQGGDERAVVTDPLVEEEGLDFPLIELFFFAYRDFIADADEVLEAYGMGRAHHRVLHFVNRQPGMVVAELLDILRITKQSLGPVLRQLVDSGLLVQQAGPSDRRQRLLYPTQKGRNLSIELTHIQSRRIKGAIEGLQNRDRDSIKDFLLGMIEPEERDVVDELMQKRD